MLKITIEPYQSEFKTISDSSYRSKVLNRKINQMTKVVMTLQKIRLLFILCFEFPFIYHYNGTSLYSSIFDGSILNYYDNTMQINMPADKTVRIVI